MPRYDAAWIADMLGDERVAATPPESLLDLAGVKRGDRVADIGCGPGFLSLPAARRVGPDGAVWAIDVAPEMTRLVEQRAADAGLAAIIRPLLSAPDRLPLADGVATKLLCALVLHELGREDAGRLLREMLRVGTDGARLLVVELQPAVNGPRPNRLSPDECAALLRAGGWLPGGRTTLGAISRGEGADEMYAVVAQRHE